MDVRLSLLARPLLGMYFKLSGPPEAESRCALRRQEQQRDKSAQRELVAPMFFWAAVARRRGARASDGSVKEACCVGRANETNWQVWASLTGL